jgi:hypothetical protein
MPPTSNDIIRTPGPFTGIHRYCRAELQPTRAYQEHPRVVIVENTGPCAAHLVSPRSAIFS